jgi:hypothetical protein
MNKLGFGALLNVNHCKSCEYCLGVVLSPKILQRIACNASSQVKLLELYTSCAGSIKSNTCQKCVLFNGIDSNTGYLDCNGVKRKKTKVVKLFPQKKLTVNFPFSIKCAKTGNSCMIEQCINQLDNGSIEACQFFKGIYTHGTFTKVCCTHSKAVSSEYIQRKFNKPKSPKQKTLHTPCLSWLFEDSVKTRRLSLKVDCMGADRRHYSQNLSVNCLNNGIEIAECRQCPQHLGVKGFKINCKLYPTAIFIPHCPHGKGATHKKGCQVSLQTCIKCPQFLEIVDDKVRCRYTKLQGYVSNPPSRTSRISKLTRKPKFYYDCPD